MKPDKVIFRATIVGKYISGWWIFKQNIVSAKIIGVKEPKGLILIKGLGTYVDVPASYGLYCDSRIGDTITFPAVLDEESGLYQHCD